MYLKYKVCYESVRSSGRHGRRGGKFMFEIRKQSCGLCLVGKIVPDHRTTICALENLCMTLEVLDQSRYSWDCNVSIIEFYKGVSQLGGR